MSTESRAVKVIAEEITKAINALVETNNKTYVVNQIKNNNGSGGHYSGTIDASHVTGLYTTVASYIVNAEDHAEQGDPVAASIITVLNSLADLRIASATIETAQIEDLYVSYGEFINLVAQDAEIEHVDVEQLRADFAEMGLANIGSANIGYGQIKDLTTETAIIREGVGGKLYIDRLAVSDANIVSLTAGEVMLKDSDGYFVRLVVDQHGDITSERVSFSGNNVITDNTMSGNKISNGTITGGKVADNSIGAGKIIENSITARELNVSSIFADQALIGAIKAGNIDTASLFASTAFITSLETAVISSPSIGEDLDVSGNSSITMLNSKIGLLVEGDSTTELNLTDGAIEAIADIVDTKASTINLSANNTVRITSANQITASAVNNLDLSSNGTVHITSANQIDIAAVNALNLSGNSTVQITSAGQISATAAAGIDLSSNSSVQITSASQISATAASAIDLSANNTIQITSGNQISATAASAIDLSANNTIKISSANQIEIDALNNIDLSSNGSIALLTDNLSFRIEELEDTNNTIKRWITFSEEGLKQGKEGSVYSTLIDDTGFHVLQKNEKITSIAKRQVAAEEFRVGKVNTTETRCVLREAGDGGMIITVEGLI